MVQKCIVMCD